MPVPEIIGPTVLSAQGDSYNEPAQVRAILWEGATTAGDTCEVREQKDDRLLFAGRAIGTQTWQGVVLPMTAPMGFRLTQISAGRVIVYHAEPDAV